MSYKHIVLEGKLDLPSLRVTARIKSIEPKSSEFGSRNINPLWESQEHHTFVHGNCALTLMDTYAYTLLRKPYLEGQGNPLNRGFDELDEYVCSYNQERRNMGSWRIELHEWRELKELVLAYNEKYKKRGVE